MDNKVLLIGNGFDIYHCFPTQYIDFLSVINFLCTSYDQSMDTIGKVFRKMGESNSNIETCYAAYSNVYDSTSLEKECVLFLINTAKENLWFQYLNAVLDINCNWIDFEKVIGNVISIMHSFLENCNCTFSLNRTYENRVENFILKNFDFFFSKDDCSVRDILKDLDKMKNVRIKSIDLSSCEDYRVDNEYIVEMPYGSQNFIVNKTKIISVLYRQLIELAEMLKQYLNLFVEAVMENLPKSYVFQNNFDAKYIISFNYTNTYEKIYYAGKEISYIHGNVNSNIILGINADENDEMGNLDTSFLKFKKYYQRVYYGTDVKYLSIMRKIRTLKRAITTNGTRKIELHVFGHSLDLTDKDVIVETFKEAEKIIIYYHNKDAMASHIENLEKIFGKNGFEGLHAEKKLEFMEIPQFKYTKK